MKIKNIVFSGVMGAILATAANAAPTIASKAYVDGLIDNNVTNLSQTIEANHNALSADIAENADAIAGNVTAIQNMEAAYKAADAETLSSAKGYTDQEITRLNESLSDTGTNVGALSGKLDSLTERVSTNETDITTNASGVADNKAAIDAINNADTGLLSQAKAYTDNLAENAVATNTAAIETLNGSGEGSVAKSIADAIATYATIKYVDDQDTALSNRITTNANAIGAVASLTTTETTNTVGAINEVNANVTKLMAGAEIVGSVNNTVQTYAIPKPSDSDCDAASGLCVLSVSSDGTTLQWVDVTDTVTTDESTTGGQEA